MKNENEMNEKQNEKHKKKLKNNEKRNKMKNEMGKKEKHRKTKIKKQVLVWGSNLALPYLISHCSMTCALNHSATATHILQWS